jgi:hypothetical protein
MVYKITLETDFLRAELFDRDTVDEVKSFLLTVSAASVKNLRACILLRIHTMMPIFPDDPYDLIRHVGTLPLLPSWKIALLGDTTDFRGTHESIEAVAGKFKLNLWTFQDEAAAQLWFKDWRARGERRRPQDRRQPRERHYLQTMHFQQERRGAPERRLRSIAAPWH